MVRLCYYYDNINECSFVKTILKRHFRRLEFTYTYNINWIGVPSHAYMCIYIKNKLQKRTILKLRHYFAYFKEKCVLSV
jgi:hypothetical protein